MAGNLKKFVNPRFIKTIDLALMKPLLARHAGKYEGFTVDLLDQEEDVAREELEKLLTGSRTAIPRSCAAICTASRNWAMPAASRSSRRRPPSGRRSVPGYQDRRRRRAQQGA
ncbi:hypothetical protein [Paracoccus suum]|uniref:hypothetical protein n=1 Tax=Paracoccus suum TaxID=2259340 RepID=UPI0013B05FC5|nr:hypothetical protein [Paracoccus suum]